MPTPQVTNPANLFTAVTPAGKQTDAGNPTHSFEQVLSREVADRQQVSRPTKMDKVAAPRKEPQPAASSAHASAPRTASQSTSVDAKQPSKNKVSREQPEKKENAQDIKDAVPQSPEELLDMVASMVEMTTAAPEDTSIKEVPQDAQAVIDPAILLAASGMLHADQKAVRMQKPDVMESELQYGGAALELGADRRGVDVQDLLLGQGFKRLSDKHESAADELRPALPGAGASTGELAALASKGQELVQGANSQQASSDFSAQLQDGLTHLPATTLSIQQIAHAATRTMQGNGTDRLTPAVGSAGWDQALGQKVVWMVAGEQQSASLTLNPPDLGPLQVVLNVNNSQASATFTAAQPEVRQALEAALPKLRDMLGEAGIQLGQATVNSGSPNQQSQQGQSFASRRGSQTNGGADAVGTAAAQPGRVAASSGGIGMVDTFV